MVLFYDSRGGAGGTVSSRASNPGSRVRAAFGGSGRRPEVPMMPAAAIGPLPARRCDLRWRDRIRFARQTKPVTILPEFLPASVRALLLLLVGSAAFALFGGCAPFEEKRIMQLKHEKGFGTRAEGDATREDYIGGLDTIQFLIDPRELTRPGAERLVELTAPQPIGLDGTIHVPYVGPVYVLGRTETEASALVQSQLRAVFNFELDVQVRIIVSQKFFYAVGEVARKGPQALTPDMVLMDAMFRAGWTGFANLGRVYLIRPDAEAPLVIDVNFREMVTTGLTEDNFQIREHDILYVPPTFLGLIGRMLERITQPVGLAVRTLFGISQIRTSYEVVTGEREAIFFRF